MQKLMESVRAFTARRVAGINGLNNPIWGSNKEKFATVIQHPALLHSQGRKDGEDGGWVRWKTTGEPFKRISLPDRENELFRPIPGRNIHSLFPAKMSSGDDAEQQQIVSLELSESTSLVLQRGDITKWSVDGVSDAIVNAANERMLGGGGVDGAIHRAAGPELLRACLNVPEVQPGVRCPTGSARITEAFQLPVSHIIHTVGPIYDSEEDPASALSSAYRNCLKLARENHIKYVAFPAISCGVYGYPVNEAAKVALSAIRESADDLEEVLGGHSWDDGICLEVHFVLFDEDAWKAWLEAAYELLGEHETTVE